MPYVLSGPTEIKENRPSLCSQESYREANSLYTKSDVDEHNILSMEIDKKNYCLYFRWSEYMYRERI